MHQKINSVSWFSFLRIIIKAGKIKEYERVVSHEMNGKQKRDVVGISSVSQKDVKMSGLN